MKLKQSSFKTVLKPFRNCFFVTAKTKCSGCRSP